MFNMIRREMKLCQLAFLPRWARLYLEGIIHRGEVTKLTSVTPCIQWLLPRYLDLAKMALAFKAAMPSSSVLPFSLEHGCCGCTPLPTLPTCQCSGPRKLKAEGGSTEGGSTEGGSALGLGNSGSFAALFAFLASSTWTSCCSSCLTLSASCSGDAADVLS
jgi:hypothetical protein